MKLQFPYHITEIHKFKTKIENRKKIQSQLQKTLSPKQTPMGDTCSACNSATTTDQIKIQVQGNKDKVMAELNHEEQNNNKKIDLEQSKKTEKKKEVSVLTSKMNKSKDYLKLDRGGVKLEKMPDYSNQVTKKKADQLGAFMYDKDEFEDDEAEYKQPMEFQTKYVYEGQWKNNQRNGRGKQLWKDGSVYQGYWKDNLAHGYGRLIHTDGDVYIGQWAHDKANGKGTYISQCGAKYVGEWVEDKQNGKGEQTWPDEAVYIGEYKNGKKHGKGKFMWTDDSSYEGDFFQNNIHGFGKYEWKDGRAYEGEWKNNKMQGKGTFTWPDGRKYVGDYVEDRKQGFGVFTFKDGRIYEGEWLNGKQHGRGVFKKKNVSREGVWENGQRVKWLDEQKQNGEIKKSKRQKSQLAINDPSQIPKQPAPTSA